MWNEILGHKQNKEFLKQVFQEQKTNSALLFYGPSGIGKNLMAKRFAQSFLCHNHKEENDGCPSCKAFAINSHPDFIEVKQVLSDKDKEKKKTDARGKFIVIDQIKEMAKQAVYAPTLSPNKVCVIDAADFMTEEAQNSLLKLLEEPPEFWTFILVATDINKLLPTILSRTIKVRFDNLEFSEVAQILKEQALPEADVLAELAEGSPGRALYIDSLGALEARENVLGVLDALPNKGVVNFVKNLDWLDKIPKQNAQLTLELLELLLRDGLFVKEKLNDKVVNKDVLFRLEKIFAPWDSKQIKESFALTNKAYKAVTQDVGGKSVIETLIIEMNELWKEG